MKILVIGSTGLIGKAVAQELSRDNELIGASRKQGVQVDIDKPESIRQMYEKLGKVDAVVCCSGNAVFKPLQSLDEQDLLVGIQSKLLGQVNLVRYGLQHVSDGGSFTLTSGVLAQQPMPGSAAVSLVNAALEAFARAAALELPRGIRINVVSPGWLTETLRMLGMDASMGQSAASVAKAYAASVHGKANGQTLGSRDYR